MAVRDRVKSYRERMRAQGYRLVQHWVPDTRSEEFGAAARVQSRLVATSPTAAIDQDFVEQVAVPWDE